jgi:hypothetical protein
MRSSITLDLPHAADNPRNSEGSFVTLADGRILFAYSRFYGAEGDDHGAADICGRFSDDNGEHWSDTDAVLVKNEGGCNVMSVSLLCLQDGRIALFYGRKNGLDDCRLYLRTSDDDARTWSDPVCCIPAPGYFVVNNDRVIQLRSGRLVAPAGCHRQRRAATAPNDYHSLDFRGIALFFLSDDGGRTWRESQDWRALPVRSGSGLQEPGVVELQDGSLYAYCRTDIGCHYEMRSADAGETWTPPSPSVFLAPCSPLSIKRLPQTGELLAVWNDYDPRWGGAGRTANPYDGRNPLAMAISRDEGQTWECRKLVENDPSRGFCYTAIHGVADGVLLAYCCGERKTGQLADLCIRKIDNEWLHEQEARS